MSARGGGRQSMSELKLRRVLEHNQRLREDLARPRLRVSEASARSVFSVLSFRFDTGLTSSFVVSLIRYCKTTKDHLVCCRNHQKAKQFTCLVFPGTIRLGPCSTGGGPLRSANSKVQVHNTIIRKYRYATPTICS